MMADTPDQAMTAPNVAGYLNVDEKTVHRLANPGDEPLHLIEVQCGAYLGEDDIVRPEDQYGRAGEAG